MYNCAIDPFVRQIGLWDRLHLTLFPSRVILGLEVLDLQSKSKNFLTRGSKYVADSRIKKSHCFSKKNKSFLARE